MGVLLVAKIQHQNNFKMEKKFSINNKKNNNNKKTPASRDESMTPECAFSMNQSVGAGDTQRGKGSHISVSGML